MRKMKFNRRTKNIVLIVLSCIMLFGAIFGLVSLFRQDKTTKEINPTYSVGALDMSTGKYVETKSAIYTKEGIECQGLTTSLDFDAVVKYQLYFYSEHDEFIHTTGTLTSVFNSTDVPVYAKYVRIVVIPNEDENISWLERFDYAKQLNVEVDKEQNFKMSKNLFTIAEDVESGNYLDFNDGETLCPQGDVDLSSLIKLDRKHNVLLINSILVPDGCYFGLYQYDETGKFLSYVNLLTSADKIYNVSTGSYYYTYSFPEQVDSFRVLALKTYEVSVYLY